MRALKSESPSGPASLTRKSLFPTGSPADKIMQRLVREGGAVLMAPDEKYWPKQTERQKPYH